MVKPLKIIGRFEIISFPDYYQNKVKAKIDTGAYTSSIHATGISEVIENGKKQLRFNFLGDKKNKVVFNDYNSKLVKSSNGESQNRFVVKLQVLFMGKVYVTNFTLTKRKSMNFSVLIGRKFLKNRFLVDVSKTYTIN